MKTEPLFLEKKNHIHLRIRVKTEAHANTVLGIKENRLYLSVRAKPLQGQANKSVIQLLSDFFDVAKSHITIHKGELSPYKEVIIEAKSREDIENRLRGCQIIIQ